jgi:hypothetical protein
MLGLFTKILEEAGDNNVYKVEIDIPNSMHLRTNILWGNLPTHSFLKRPVDQ